MPDYKNMSINDLCEDIIDDKYAVQALGQIIEITRYDLDDHSIYDLLYDGEPYEAFTKFVGVNGITEE